MRYREDFAQSECSIGTSSYQLTLIGDRESQVAEAMGRILWSFQPGGFFDIRKSHRFHDPISWKVPLYQAFIEAIRKYGSVVEMKEA